MPDLDFPHIEKWIQEVAGAHGRMIGALSYIFCDDERIIQVNRQYLGHDYYTDIITFDDCRGRLLRGDMFISLDTVRSNAVLQRVDYRDELLRVVVHGVLHLCGINDKGPGERAVMEAHEDSALGLLQQMSRE